MNIAGDDTNSRRLALYNSDSANIGSALSLTDTVDGTNSSYKVFGQHNKPTGIYTGNGSAASRTIPFIDVTGYSKGILITCPSRV